MSSAVTASADSSTNTASPRETEFAHPTRLDELGAAPSVGSRGDAYDNAMAEAWVATFKSELVDGRRFPSFEHTEHETLAWISFYNSERLHEQLGDLPPLEYEQNQLEQNGYPARRPTSSEVAPRSHARARVPQPHDPWEVNDASAGDSTSSRR